MSQREDFETHRVEGLRVVHRTRVPPERVAQAIALHQESVARARDACLKWGPGSSVSRVLIRSGDGDLDMAVKGITWRGFGGALSDALHGSRARRALAASRRLGTAGLLSPEVLAIAARRRRGVVHESFTLTRFLHGFDPLPVALARLRERTARRRALLRAAGRAVGALHAAGFDHRDLKHSNLLVAADGRIAFLDLEALGRLAPLRWRRRVRALALLESFARDLYAWLPERERLCFLRAWLAAQADLAGREGDLVRAVRRESALRLARRAARPREAERHFPLAPRDVIPCTVADAVQPSGELARGSRT